MKFGHGPGILDLFRRILMPPCSSARPRPRSLDRKA
jgi:hypothetical protein